MWSNQNERKKEKNIRDERKSKNEKSTGNGSRAGNGVSHFAHAGTAATTAEMMQIKATPTTTATNRPKTFTLIRLM